MSGTRVRDYLKNNIKQWKKDSYEACEGKCVITGEASEVIHHSYPFALIVKETLKRLNYKGVYTEDYTIEQLKIAVEMCNKIHYEYGLGVCLTDAIHKEYHGAFGFWAKPSDFEVYRKYKTDGVPLPIIKKIKDLFNVFIYRSELDQIMKMKSYNERYLLFHLLVYSKEYSRENKDFYMTYKQMKTRSALSERTCKRIIPKLLKMYPDVIEVLKSESNCLEKTPNVYKFSITQEGDIYQVQGNYNQEQFDKLCWDVYGLNLKNLITKNQFYELKNKYAPYRINNYSNRN